MSEDAQAHVDRVLDEFWVLLDSNKRVTNAIYSDERDILANPEAFGLVCGLQDQDYEIELSKGEMQKYENEIMDLKAKVAELQKESQRLVEDLNELRK